KDKSEMEIYQRENVITWFLFLLFIGIANTLNIIWRFLIVDSNTAIKIDYISIIFVYIGIFIKILNIERGINRSGFYKGYWSSIILLIAIIYAIILNPITLKEFGPFQLIFLILMVASFAIFPGIFLYIAFKSTDNARKNALKVVGGSLLIASGLMLQPQNVEDYIITLMANTEFWLNFLTIICPIMITLGIILIFDNYRRTL
ncbi:MAG: hypothetical protein ACTSQG_07445, partial [Promethearchaeota archaeon]